MGWQSKGVRFTAAGAAAALEFHSLNPPGYWGPVIDNVRVAPAALAANCT